MNSIPEILAAPNRVTQPTVRRTSFDDYEQIAVLERAVGLTPRSRDQWLHLWLNNPAYQSVRDWPIGWVLENESGEIVGSIGNLPLLYCFNGRTFLGATFLGWAVDPRYRAFSLGLISQQLRQPNIDLQMVTTASPTTQRLFTKLGWSRVPVGRWDRSAFWVTNYAGAVRQYVASKAPWIFPNLAGPLHDGPTPVDDAAFKAKSSRAGYELSWCTGFDERFDRFWTELQESGQNRFLSSRTRQELDWHFKDALAQERIWILTACKDRKLAGYVILTRKDAQTIDLVRMMLVDLQTLGHRRELSSAMVSYALDRCRRERIHIMENTGCWLEDLQLVVKRPTFHRDLESWCYLYKAMHRDLGTVLSDAGSWCPTQYDGDASI